MRVLIIGGGIGGLSLALMLKTLGISCKLYEAASNVRPLGVGINLLPQAVAQLAELDLLSGLDEVGIRTRELRYLNRFGQQIWSEPRGMWAGHAVPQFSIHRGQLHNLLWHETLRRIGADDLVTGHRLASLSQDQYGVRAHFENGHIAEGDILVGCDGIHSVARKVIHANDKGIRWNGIQMWRGSVEWPSFEGGDTMVVAGGMDQKLVLYPIAKGASDETRLTNWVVTAQIGVQGQPPPRKEDWSRLGELSELLPHAARFKIPFLDVCALIRASVEFWEYPMCDRDPLSHWTDRRITLLGDAAHAMYPVGSNGASQAILDGRCLADLLAAHAPEEALLRYEAERLPRTAEIVHSNRSGGPERVIDVVSNRAPDGFKNITDVISTAELQSIATGYAKMTDYGHRAR